MPQWVDACSTDEIDQEDVMRWDHGGRTYALYHSPEGEFFCTDGLCTHESVHLAGGVAGPDARARGPSGTTLMRRQAPGICGRSARPALSRSRGF